MITKFKLFERVSDSDLENGEYYYIPFFDRKLIKILLEKEKSILRLGNERMEMILEQLKEPEYDNLIGLYILVGKSGFSGFWGNVTNENENSKRIEFFKDNNMIDRGILTLEPYEIDANKYNI